MTEQTVRELLAERIDGEIEAVAWYKSTGSANYGLVTSLTDDARAQLTTVLIDTDDDTLRVLPDSSMWLPADPDVLDAATSAIARTTSAAAGSEAVENDDGPMTTSLLAFDADEIGGYALEDDYEPTDAGADWKETGGREERWKVHGRLKESPIANADRFIRLEFEGKAPWPGAPQRNMYHPKEVGANYGVEVSEDDDLVIVDVDDLDECPIDELPETLRSESPHGGEHRFYHVPGWQEVFQDRFGVDNPHPSWGEVRSQDGYVVGPGSFLTDCKHDDCCTEDDPGEYKLDDGPIATIDAEDLADLLAPFREVVA